MSTVRRTEEEILTAYERCADAVYRVCRMFLTADRADIMDAFQQTFLKYMVCTKKFENSEHEKAWLIVTASNVCRDILRSSWRKKVMLKDELPQRAAPSDEDEIFRCVKALPEKYKTAVYLHYYEGYSASEIAKLTGRAESTVYAVLSKARKQLKQMLTEDEI